MRVISYKSRVYTGSIPFGHSFVEQQKLRREREGGDSLHSINHNQSNAPITTHSPSSSTAKSKGSMQHSKKSLVRSAHDTSSLLPIHYWSSLFSSALASLLSSAKMFLISSGDLPLINPC